MALLVRLWKKGRQGEPYSLIGIRRVSVEEERRLRKYYDVEFLGVVDDD